MIAHLAGRDRRCPPSGYRAGSTRSDRTRPTAPPHSRRRRKPRAARTRDARHCCCAVRSAAGLMSVPTPQASGNSDNSANRIAPDPVPISAMRAADDRGWRSARHISSASSTTVSVSGLGTSVAGESCRGRPQNSLIPRMRATGSPARRRCAKSSRRIDCSARDRPRRRRDQPGEIEAQRRADQHPRVEFGRIDGLCPKPRGQHAPRRFDG